MSLERMSLQASAIILFALLARLLLLNRLPKRTFVALWLLAAARMLIPVELPFRYGADALLRRAVPLPAAVPPAGALPPRAVSAAWAAAVVRTSAATPAFPLWRAVWLAGVIACVLALLLPHLRWRRIYARSLPLEDANVERWLRERKPQRKVRVRVSDEIPTPLCYGLLHPTILLPSALDRSDFRRLAYVLEHELTHILRFDLPAKLAFAAALCAHWFNPLAWIMYLLANRDVELACDEAVLRRFGEPARQEYARALIDLAARRSGLPNPLSSGFGRQTIEERIRAIMKARHLTKIAAIAAALLIAFTALAFATSAEEEPSKTTNPEIEALLFDGWEDESVRDYAARIAALPEIEDPDGGGLPDGYLEYVYYPLLYDLDSLQITSGGSANADSGEMLLNYEVVMKITDPDHLTVGKMRDAKRGVEEGLMSFDCESATQEELQKYVMELAARWSDGETIVFDILAELPGPDSPYADAQTWTYLQKYAPLGLSFDYYLGNLSMYYEGQEIRAVIDPESGITIANSAGTGGLGGDGPFLLVEYEGGAPAALRRISSEEYAALSASDEGLGEQSPDD